MIRIIGAGAVGTTLAALAVAAGREPVSLQVRARDRAAFAAIDTLRVERRRGALVVPRPALREDRDLDGVDYLLVAVKHAQLDAAIDALPAPPPSCTVVSALNGLSALRRLRERLPQTRVVPMTVMFNAQRLGPLHTELTTSAQLVIGSDDRRLRRAFAAPGVRVRSGHGEAAAWGKLLINLANAICALTHATFRDLLTQRALRDVYVAVLDEAVGILDATRTPYDLPLPLPYRLYRAMLAGNTQLPWHFARLRNGLGDGAYPSMVADVEQGRPTEADTLNGEIARLAQAHGLRAPLNAALVARVQAMHGRKPPPYVAAQTLREQLCG
ncbi:ketopantoate reductase family protein [Solimonas soli]|uniref:ketopantoate reductase family protein n=1 Tax=Solimonas soli TaxID=413479 RepID=UPI000480BDBF|nr:2-dehydropantoate 2-reductase [Solimonas soli]